MEVTIAQLLLVIFAAAAISCAFWTVDQIREEQRISVPSMPACENAIRPDPPRPGEVRIVAGDLEVLIQRSNWCSGFEVRMVYQELPPEPLVAER